MNRKLLIRTLLILVVGSAILVATLGAPYLLQKDGPRVATSGPNERTFAKPGEVPIGGPFTLSSETGEIVTEEDFRDKYLLVFFGYTHCPDVCPTTLNEIARTMDRLGAQEEAVQPLFISVDPDRDPPKTLAEYTDAFHPRIIGLTGTKEQIDNVVKEYRVFYEKVSAESYYEESSQNKKQTDSAPGDDYLMSHSGNTYLMSPEGEYLTHFTYGTKPEEMAETIRRAIAKFGRPKT